MSQRCPLCERRKKEREQFCKFHTTAMMNLEHAYAVWNEAFGDLDKEKYYSDLERHPDTGLAVKDVIRYLRGK
jgi:hypothetical protein